MWALLVKLCSVLDIISSTSPLPEPCMCYRRWHALLFLIMSCISFSYQVLHLPFLSSLCLPFLRLVGVPHQWYAQRMRSESHTSSDYQDASEYLDMDANTGYYQGSNQNSDSSTKRQEEEDNDKLDDEPEIDDQNVGEGDTSGVSSCNDNIETHGDRSGPESEKNEFVSGEAGPSLLGDSVNADDAGSTDCISNESL